MNILREVRFSVRKGLGPKWVEKTVTVFLDDAPDDFTETQLRDAIIDEAKSILYRIGYTEKTVLFLGIDTA